MEILQYCKKVLVQMSDIDAKAIRICQTFLIKNIIEGNIVLSVKLFIKKLA